MPPCKEKTSKRYLAPRKAPPYVAKNCQNELYVGERDKWYISAKNKTQWRWVDADKRADRLRKGSRKSRKSLKSRKSRKSRKSLRKSQSKMKSRSPQMVLRARGA
jgi:hypothetical protein